MFHWTLFALLTTALVLSAYGATLPGAYVADDYQLLGQLVDEEGHPAVGEFVSGLVTPLADDVAPRFYRPLWRGSFFVDIVLFGAEPLLSRLLSLVLHLANALLLCALYTRLLDNRAVAFLGAALFAVYPGHIEAVVWVAARNDLMSLFFTLSALNVYAHALQARERPGTRAATILLLVAALCSKESALLCVPAISLLYWQSLRSDGSVQARILRTLAATWWAWAVLAAFIGLRTWIVGGLTGGYSHQAQATFLHPGFLDLKATLLAGMAVPFATPLASLVSSGVIAALVVVALIAAFIFGGLPGGRVRGAIRFAVV